MEDESGFFDFPYESSFIHIYGLGRKKTHLHGVGLVDNVQIEAYVLVEREGPFSLFMLPDLVLL